MDKRFFFAALSSADPAALYRARVVADGGVVASMRAVRAAYRQATAWGLPPDATHWSSPQFGYKLDGQGQVMRRYCLFGLDAELADGAKPWSLTAPAAGKPAQHRTNNALLAVPSPAWRSIELTVHALVLPTTWVAADGNYPFFPIAEGADSFNLRHAFVLAAEIGAGIEGGLSTPPSIVGTGAYPSLNALHAVALRVDPTQPVPGLRRVWVDGVEGTQQITTGTPVESVYDRQLMYVGGRGAEVNYNWQGNINDVLITNLALPDAALGWLNSQVIAY